MLDQTWPRYLAAAVLATTCIIYPPAGARAQDAPGVAFVSTLDGDVTVQRGDSGDVVAAGVNAPLMVGDYVSTGPNGRAEVQFDYGHAVRMAPGSQIRFAQMAPGDDTVQLASGSVGVGVIHATNQYTEVETPSATIRPREAGYYRVSVLPDGTTAITVRRGNAAVLLPQGTRWLDPGSTMLVSGPADNPSFRYEHTVAYDSFDGWNSDRNIWFERANAYQYAPQDPGLYDLTGYGTWESTAQYGAEWEPNVPSDWSPYSDGEWTYEPYYGWTWVDNDPWGYAPFHYGRWYRHHDRWAWVPGPRVAVAAWSPALVAFFGFGGGGVNVSISLVDNIGWVPLAPAEPFYPWWGAGAVAVGTLAVTNVETVYHNARWPGAARGLSRTQFANGGYARIGPVAAASFQRAAVMHRGLPVVPEAAALRYTQRAPAMTHAPAVEAFHNFRTTPRAPQTFAQQRSQAATYAQRVSYVQAHQHRVPARPAPQSAARPAPHPAPAQRPAFVQHAAPHPQAAARPVQHPAVQHPAMQQHAAPAYHPQTVQHPAAPAYHPAAPAYHPAQPAYHAPAQQPQQRPQAIQRPQPAVQHPQPALQRPAAQPQEQRAPESSDHHDNSQPPPH